MRQYFEAKRQYRHALLFFRMGDFYEMFYEDALVASRALDLTLTSRSKDASGAAVPMCGVPFHAADGYIARLVKKGYRVAICEQIEDPKKAKGVVKRDVVRVVSPGTLTDAAYLDVPQVRRAQQVRRVRSTVWLSSMYRPASSMLRSMLALMVLPHCARRSRFSVPVKSSSRAATISAR
jgi:DNA mismatch repair ATPase MutS